MIVSDTKKATKAQNRVRDFPGPLVDHDALDRTDPRVIRSVNRSALNLVAAIKLTVSLSSLAIRSSF